MRGRLFPVADGWYEWRQDPPLAQTVRVRVGVADGGRLVLLGLQIDGSPSADLLRAIPIGRIEAAANAQLAVSHESIDTSPVLNLRARPVAPPIAGDTGWEMVEPALAVSRTVADGGTRTRGRPDVFYREVADVYLDFAQGSARPACDLADRHGVPVSTAHRWVKEARRRGFLPPGRPGKSG